MFANRTQPGLRVALGLAVGLALGASFAPGAQAQAPAIQPVTQASVTADRSDASYAVIAGAHASRSQMPRATASAYGGAYTAYTGEQVYVIASDYYQQDDAANQTYADYVASFSHGSELARAVIVLVSPAELAGLCTTEANGCYYPAYQAIVISPDSPSRGADLLHEYGHHLASNRDNEPFSAYDYGPKRWATRVGSCPNVKQGSLDPEIYELNPAEGFAEAYAVTHGVPWAGVVADVFNPDTETQALIREDATDPWSGNTTSTLRDSIANGYRIFRTVTTPLDGRLRLRLRGPASADFDLFLLSGREIVRRSTGPGSTERINYTVCGQRKLRLMVYAKDGSGLARVRVSKP